ncbi:MAG TPA: amidohydrolase [Flavobacteriales bacterium]|nr:amidohydrolase [Flavobacteriales bacterium]
MNRSLLLTFVLIAACGYRDREADVVVHNAVIHSLDGMDSVHQAMAIKDGRIIELGPEQQIRNRYRAKQTYNAAGQHIYPGFADGHCHFYGYGLNKQKVDLQGARDWDEAVARVEAFAKAHPGSDWILARGWDQNRWPVKEYPDNTRLNALFPDRPVLMQRIDGHAAVVNQAALGAVGLDPEKAIEGGLMLKRDGRFTGVLIDNAVQLFQPIMEQASEATKRQALLDAQRDCFAVGLTMVHDAGLDPGTIDLIKRMHEEGSLKMRVYAMVSDSAPYLEHFARSGAITTDRLSVRSVKVYADGALGSRGALLKEPYSDMPHHHGLQLASRNHFEHVARWCDAHGFQMNTHCIGDSANKLLLDVYAQVLGGANDKRWRIEHAQVVSASDRGLFARYSIIPSVQPTHATSDGPWAGDRLGEARVADAYAYDALRKAMGIVALGTDFPVEGIDPLQTYRSAVLRQAADGWPEGGYQMSNALSRRDALMGMTIWNALAAFRDNELGTLEVGKRADFTVVNADLEKASPEALRLAKVVATWIEGEKVFGK